MNMGDTVSLVSLIADSSVYYEIQSGADVVELGSDNLTAIGPGTAIVNAIDWNDDSRVWSCTITVTVAGFSGSALYYKLIGRWEDGDSYLVFNQNKTGDLKVYKNGSLLQESTFTWTTFENSYGKYLTLTLKLMKCPSENTYSKYFLMVTQGLHTSLEFMSKNYIKIVWNLLIYSIYLFSSFFFQIVINFCSSVLPCIFHGIKVFLAQPKTYH